ncbi:Uncharacterised protein [Legionella hackeliae]|uniref:hypothetical protein n=1 Tax=Legionella hackeliae TaxID=449 RepID=UPI000E150F11|nr:hypothetical protein [Legionella hackeliae]STX49514.1 Uncharacterised protein [Legionella hackeliae]
MYPKKLQALLDSPTKRSLIAKYLKMGLGSLVCVVPFSIAVYLFPIPGCDTDWCLGLTVSHSTLSSTILHGVAWGIILTPDYWYYRLPILPLEKLYSLIKKSCTPKEKLELLRLTDLQQTIQAKYKNQLIGTFSKAVQAIINQRSQTEEAAVKNNSR